jgi:hypothetical protein
MAKSNKITIDKRFKVSKNRSEKVLNWGESNNYPQFIKSVLEQSGRTLNAVRTYAKFIKGGGFAEPTFYKLKVNGKGLTMDKVLRKVTEDYSTFNGFALHFNYNLNFDISEINIVDFETTRLAIPNMKGEITHIAIHPDWARQDPDNKFSATDIEYINVFNPANVAEEIEAVGGIENYKGQIYWYSVDGMNYPHATFDAEVETAQTDIEIKMFNFQNITTNFMASHLLITGEAESDEEREDFVENLKGFQGARDASKVLWVEKKSEDEVVDLKKFEIQNNDRMFEHTQASVNERLRKLYNIPPVLLGDLVSGKLGTASEIQDAVNFYNGWTIDERIEMEEVFKYIFEFYWNKQINPTQNFSIIPIQNISA